MQLIIIGLKVPGYFVLKRVKKTLRRPKKNCEKT